jgi:cell division transport system ATP-binding protein
MISLVNVTVGFNGHVVLDDISLQIQPGDFVFLVGQTGAGKSTLMRLLYMDLMPTKGIVTVGQYSSATISTKQKPRLRRMLGIIFQDFRLMEDRNVYDNVAFTLHVTGTPGASIKKKVLHALADVGLNHQRNKMAHELSGGEQQRVVIARAIVNDPIFLLADEPTGNLDPATSFEILQVLRTINTRGTAVIMATHNYELVRKTNVRVLQIKEGKVSDVKMK